MILDIVILVIGFIVLIKGADLFVDSASSLAENFSISKMLIALTIVSFGTSAPELAVSIKSMFSNSGDIVLGNVIGSNILNILLILGVCSVIHPLTVKSATVKKELPITIMITTLLIVLISDRFISNNAINALTRSDGITICLFFLVFVYYLISVMRNKTDDENQTPKYGIFKSILFSIIGILCLILGSNGVVDSASSIAKILGVSERMISLTIIALGTSLPELVTSVIATKKGEYDIAIGNVVGSNIFNIGVVLGVPLSLLGTISNISISSVDLIAFFVSALLLFLYSLKKYKITKAEGISFLVIFIIYYGYVILG